MSCAREINAVSDKPILNTLLPLFRNLRNILPLNNIKQYLTRNEGLTAAATTEATKQHKTALTASTAEIKTLLNKAVESTNQININAKTIFEQREELLIFEPIKLSTKGAELAKKEKPKHGSAPMENERQRKTRFRKRQTQKRKTRKRKNRKN